MCKRDARPNLPRTIDDPHRQRAEPQGRYACDMGIL